MTIGFSWIRAHTSLSFWQNMRLGGGGSANGILAERITNDFGSFNNFKKLFSDAAVVVEGSGWTLLV